MMIFKKLWVVLLFVLLLATAGSTYYFYSKYMDSKMALENPTVFQQKEAQELKERVGKLIELPVGEEPTIASVTDVDRLRDQEFFANAQNEDRVLIFTQAKKAILYRPSTNKIIEVGPVRIGGEEATTSATRETVLPTRFPLTATPTVTPTPTPSF